VDVVREGRGAEFGGAESAVQVCDLVARARVVVGEFTNALVGEGTSLA
jgi:hypothetical protein